MKGAAKAYGEITRAVDRYVASHDPADCERAAYLVMRAAMLRIREAHGARVAAELVYGLADEMAVLAPKPWEKP